MRHGKIKQAAYRPETRDQIKESFRKLRASSPPSDYTMWRIFSKGRPIETVGTKTKADAISFTAEVHSLSPETLIAFEEDFVADYEWKLERIQRKQLPLSSYHEAGHAVMAHHLGAHVFLVSTIPEMSWGSDLATEVDSMARVSHGPLGTARIHHDVENQVLMMLAGPIAEFRRAGRSRWKKIAGYGEMERIGILAQDQVECRDELGAKELIETWKVATATTIGELWSHVRSVADALLERRELAGEELQTVLRPVPRIK